MEEYRKLSAILSLDKLKRIVRYIHRVTRDTLLFVVTGAGGVIYFSLIACSLVTRSGRMELNPGIWLRTQIKSFSIQFSS